MMLIRPVEPGDLDALVEPRVAVVGEVGTPERETAEARREVGDRGDLRAEEPAGGTGAGHRVPPVT